MPLGESLEQIINKWKTRDREVYEFYQKHYLEALEEERKRIDEEVRDWSEKLLCGGVGIDSDLGLENALRLFHGQYQRMNIKMGIDPTIPYVLHLGHTVGLQKARLFQQLGCCVKIVIGTWTATIGDPSGLGPRKSISLEQAGSYGEQMIPVLEKVLGKDFDVHFNSTWHGDNGLTMEERDSIDDLINIRELLRMGRFEEEKGPITYKRFHYPVLQATDSLILDAHVEIGGIDQKTNILAGRELQRKCGIETQIGFLTPLLTGTDGKNKMSKSVGNHIPLNMNPHDMYGKIMSMPDRLLKDEPPSLYSLLKKLWNLPTVVGYNPRKIFPALYSTLREFVLEKRYPSDKGPSLLKEWWNLLTVVGYDPEKILPEWYSFIEDLGLERKDKHMELKRALAYRIVSRYHSEGEALRELREFERVFQRRKLPSEIPVYNLSDQERYPKVKSAIRNDSMPIYEILYITGMASSKSQARRLIKQGGVNIGRQVNAHYDAKRVDSIDELIPLSELNETIINVGPRKYGVIYYT